MEVGAAISTSMFSKERSNLIPDFEYKSNSMSVTTFVYFPNNTTNVCISVKSGSWVQIPRENGNPWKKSSTGWCSTEVGGFDTNSLVSDGI